MRACLARDRHVLRSTLVPSEADASRRSHTADADHDAGAGYLNAGRVVLGPGHCHPVDLLEDGGPLGLGRRVPAMMRSYRPQSRPYCTRMISPRGRSRERPPPHAVDDVPPAALYLPVGHIMAADVLPPGRCLMPQSGGGRSHYAMRANLLTGLSRMPDACDRPGAARAVDRGRLPSLHPAIIGLPSVNQLDDLSTCTTGGAGAMTTATGRLRAAYS